VLSDEFDQMPTSEFFVDDEVQFLGSEAVVLGQHTVGLVNDGLATFQSIS
jgi:hypothetical protein